mgnify:CR=1 FL=1
MPRIVDFTSSLCRVALLLLTLGPSGLANCGKTQGELLSELEVSSEAAAENAWGGHQNRVVRTEGGIYTVYLSGSDPHTFRVAKIEDESTTTIFEEETNATPVHLLTDGEELHVVSWEDIGRFSVWSGAEDGFTEHASGISWHNGDPPYSGAGISSDGKIYLVTCIGGNGPAGEFEWASYDSASQNWSSKSSATISERHAYPYIVPHQDTFQIIAHRDVRWEVMGYTKPPEAFDYVFNQMAHWEVSSDGLSSTHVIHEETPNDEYLEVAAHNNWGGDVLLDSEGNVHVLYKVRGPSTGGDYVLRHAVLNAGSSVKDEPVDIANPGQSGLLAESQSGKLYILTYAQGSGGKQLSVHPTSDELGFELENPTVYTLNAPVEYPGITLAHIRGGSINSNIIDGGYASDGGTKWIYFSLKLPGT